VSEENKLILPDGRPVDDEESKATERMKERSAEDESYVPVIIKRTDEKRRHPDDTLETAIEEGLEQIDRPVLSLALSSIAAGLIVGFSAMAVAVITASLNDKVDPMLIRIATAFVYPLGFVICVMSGAQLFTEHTATAVYPVLDQKASISQLFRLWSIVILGNMTGAIISATLHTSASEVVHSNEGYIIIGHHLVKFSTTALLISALLAGWLMALGAWLAVSSPRIGSQIVCIYIVTFLIGIGGLHHSIAGSVEMFAAMMVSSEFTINQAARFIGVALLGNLMGGSLFVALLNYAHIRQTRIRRSQDKFLID
jgi:formate/nitrite transporter FocA (FNT family)